PGSQLTAARRASFPTARRAASGILPPTITVQSEAKAWSSRNPITAPEDLPPPRTNSVFMVFKVAEIQCRVKNLFMKLFIFLLYPPVMDKFETAKHLEDLDAESKYLVHKAKEAAAVAYAPYSKFQVGAALLLEDGSYL